jgi:hypothetical protein
VVEVEAEEDDADADGDVASVLLPTKPTPNALVDWPSNIH